MISDDEDDNNSDDAILLYIKNDHHSSGVVVENYNKQNLINHVPQASQIVIPNIFVIRI